MAAYTPATLPPIDVPTRWKGLLSRPILCTNYTGRKTERWVLKQDSSSVLLLWSKPGSLALITRITSPWKISQGFFQTYNYYKVCKCHTHTQICTDLVDSFDLTADAVILWTGATCPLVSRHVHTHHMLVSREELEEKANTPEAHLHTLHDRKAGESPVKSDKICFNSYRLLPKGKILQRGQLPRLHAEFTNPVFPDLHTAELKFLF